MQSDPIGLAGGINTYSYVNNNPLGLMDRFGLDGLFLEVHNSAASNIQFMNKSFIKDSLSSPNNVLYIYLHANKDVIFIPKGNNISKALGYNEDIALENGEDFYRLLLKINQIYPNFNLKQYDTIELRTSDIGQSNFPQQLANISNKKILASKYKYAYGENGSIGPIYSITAGSGTSGLTLKIPFVSPSMITYYPQESK